MRKLFEMVSKVADSELRMRCEIATRLAEAVRIGSCTQRNMLANQSPTVVKVIRCSCC